MVSFLGVIKMIYQNTARTNERPSNVVEGQFRIEKATVEEPNIYTGDYSLCLQLKGYGKQEGSGVVHAIVGSPLSADFMREMKVSKVEKLVGEEVLGFIDRNGMDLRGIAPNK